jgi:hypothetical protein
VDDKSTASIMMLFIFDPIWALGLFVAWALMGKVGCAIVMISTRLTCSPPYALGNHGRRVWITSVFVSNYRNDQLE